MAELTDEERDVLGLLVEAWNIFLGLPETHADDVSEFRHAIHAAQNIVLSRLGTRLLILENQHREGEVK